MRLDCPTHQAAVTAWALSPAEGEGTEGQCELEDRDKVIDNRKQNDIFKRARTVGGRVTVEGGRGGEGTREWDDTQQRAEGQSRTRAAAKDYTLLYMGWARGVPL